MKCPIGKGNRTGYVYNGCRCDTCTKANRKYGIKFNQVYLKTLIGQALTKATQARSKTWRKAAIDEFKIRAGCLDCGYKKHPAALHFDHIKGGKLFAIGRERNRAWHKILLEIEKCEVRCANCHAERHAKNK